MMPVRSPPTLTLITAWPAPGVGTRKTLGPSGSGTGTAAAGSPAVGAGDLVGRRQVGAERHRADRGGRLLVERRRHQRPAEVGAERDGCARGQQAAGQRGTDRRRRGVGQVPQQPGVAAGGHRRRAVERDVGTGDRHDERLVGRRRAVDGQAGDGCEVVRRHGPRVHTRLQRQVHVGAVQVGQRRAVGVGRRHGGAASTPGTCCGRRGRRIPRRRPAQRRRARPGRRAARRGLRRRPPPRRRGPS